MQFQDRNIEPIGSFIRARPWSCHKRRNRIRALAPAILLRRWRRPLPQNVDQALSILKSQTLTTPTSDSNTYPSSRHPDNCPKIAVSQMESNSYVVISPMQKKSTLSRKEEGSLRCCAPGSQLLAPNSRLTTHNPHSRLARNAPDKSPSCRGRIGSMAVNTDSQVETFSATGSLRTSA